MSTLPQPSPGLSLRRFLLLGILGPVLAVVGMNTAHLYVQALAAADNAYDRTLLASAKAIGEQLEVAVDRGQPRLRSTVPYSALEAFEADNRSRMYYKVTGFAGELVSGFDDLPAARPDDAGPGVYAALVHFYDDRYRGQKVRMAVLLQPVAGFAGQGMATIQVAETLELRRALAGQLLTQTLWQQVLLLGVIALVVVVVVQRATRPVRELSQRLQSRPATDLSPLPTAHAPRELQPIVEATNAVMARLAHLLEDQKRFVRDASHQLRTPLAVLRAQVQSARRHDVEPEQALAEIDATLQRASQLAHQMLALAKVEQLGQHGDAPATAWERTLREVALDVSPLIAQGRIDFEIATVPAPVRAHEWALRELSRNLLHNAIQHTPPGGTLAVDLRVEAGQAHLTVADGGPGIAPAQRSRLFQPFAAGGSHGGSGLGLAICHGIVQSLGGRIELVNREVGGQVLGLDATVTLPLAASP